MEICFTIVASISAITSTISTVVHLVISYKKSKEPPKDEIWETATRLLCADGGCKSGDQFANLYEELKLFKEKGCSLDELGTLSHAILQKRKAIRSDDAARH